MFKQKKELSEEEKELKTKKYAELKAKCLYLILPAIFCYSIIYSFFNVYAYISRAFDWRSILFSLMLQSYNYLMGFFITELLPIKQTWIKCFLIILLATFLDCTTEFEFVNNCSNVEIILYIISCVVMVIGYLNLKYYKKFNDRFIENLVYTKKRIMKKIHLTISAILFFLMIAALVYTLIVFYINHDFFAVNIHW